MDPGMIEKTGYAATKLRSLVTGKKPNRVLGYEGEWTAKVVGNDVETGNQVTVAYYDHAYTHAADARCRASQLLRHLKTRGA
jgi:hypothetical protein